MQLPDLNSGKVIKMKGNESVNRHRGIRVKEIEPRLLSVNQTAVYLGIASKTIRNRISSDSKKPFPVKPKRIGGRVLFDKHELDRYIDSLTTESQ